MMILNKAEVPGQEQTIALAQTILEKYKGRKIKNPPAELTLARGVMAMYGQMLFEELYGKYGSDSFPEYRPVDWCGIED